MLEKSKSYEEREEWTQKIIDLYTQILELLPGMYQNRRSRINSSFPEEKVIPGQHKTRYVTNIPHKNNVRFVFTSSCL